MRMKSFALRSSDSLNTTLSGQVAFASTALPGNTFLQMAMNSPMWASAVSASYDQYRITKVRISAQPINRTSVTRSVGGFAMALDPDTSGSGSPTLTQVLSYGMSRQLAIDEHWEVLWNVPQESKDVWYDVAGVLSQQFGGFFCGSDLNFSVSTPYASLAIEVTVLARGQL